jgi:hypothetical protein
MTLVIAGQGQFIASARPRLPDRKFDHAPPDTMAAVVRMHADIFNYGRRRACVAEVVHDQQRKRTDNPPFDERHVETVVRIPAKTRESLPRLSIAESAAIVEIALGVDIEHGAEVRVSRFAELHPH